MRTGNLLLSVLGTFYAQVGKSELVRGLNDIYTSSIMYRYNDTLRRRVASGSSDIPDVSHFGYIPWSGYSPNGNITQILSPSGDEVDLSKVNYISFPYIKEGAFFRIKNGKVSQSCVNDMSEIGSNAYPVIYTINATKKMFSSGDMDYYNHIGAANDLYLTKKAIDIATSISMYGRDSFNTINTIANILCGAVYSIGEGEVLSVSATEIDTTVGTFHYDEADNGVAIVAVGESVSGVSLLTRQVTVSDNGSLLPEISKINERMRTYSSSPLRVEYLKRISSAISKRKYTVLIPTTVFTSVGRDGIATLSSILNTSLSLGVQSMTNLTENDVASGSDSSAYLITENPIATISIIEVLKVDFKDNSSIIVNIEEDTLYRDDVEASIDDSLGLSMLPLDISDTIHIVEDKLRIVDTPLNILFSESYRSDGEKTDHSITDVGTTDDLKIVGDSVLNSSDGGDTYSGGVALLKDTVSAVGVDSSTIKAYAVADILLREKRNFILKKTDSIYQDYKMTIQTTREFHEFASVLSKVKAKTENASTFSVEDNTLLSLSDDNTGFPSDSSSSVGINAMEYSTVSVDEAEALLIRIKGRTAGVDESFILSQNEIDER